MIVVFGGLGLAFVTLWAQWYNNAPLARAAAIASLVFVVLILLFVIPPLARSAKSEVAQIDFPLELTSGGLVFLGIQAIVGFAAWNTGNNLLFIVLSFLLAAFVVSLVLGSMNLKKLEARVRFPEAIFAAEPTVFTILLKNRKWILPTFSTTITLRGSLTDDPFGGRRFRLVKPPASLAPLFRLPFQRRVVGYFVYVPRRGEVEQQTEQVFERRGRFIIKDFEISTKFPFGFWRQRRRLHVFEATVYVFPPLEDVRNKLQAISRKLGQFSNARRGAGQELLGLREYDATDDVRRVDWKATARIGQLTVREYSSENERRVSLIFDTRMKDAERFERGVSVAASILAHFNSAKNETRLVIEKEISEFGLKKSHFHELLRRLAITEASEKPSEAELIFPQSEGDLQIILTPFANEIPGREDLVIVPY
ncbi:MAG TPA: DUF58 domain-containing protein [Pyrinomonadaceae bacterium]|nr:DUF58 domain-containing protein [Pyrinomonadaceae bacterium]